MLILFGKWIEIWANGWLTSVASFHKASELRENLIGTCEQLDNCVRNKGPKIEAYLIDRKININSLQYNLSRHDLIIINTGYNSNVTNLTASNDSGCTFHHENNKINTSLFTSRYIMWEWTLFIEMFLLVTTKTYIKPRMFWNYKCYYYLALSLVVLEYAGYTSAPQTVRSPMYDNKIHPASDGETRGFEERKTPS